MKMKWSKQTKLTRSNLAGACGLLLALALVLTLVMPAAVWAMPQMPYQLYGNVTINGAVASEGVPVVASIGGVQYASAVTDASGRYGYSPQFFRIPGDDPATPAKEGGVTGDTVQLSVAGVVAVTTNFASGSITNLNLAVTPQASPVTPTPPAPEPAPAPAAPLPVPAPTLAPAPKSASVPAPVPAPELLPPAPLPPPATKDSGELNWPFIGGVVGAVVMFSLAYLLSRRRTI